MRKVKKDMSLRYPTTSGRTLVRKICIFLWFSVTPLTRHPALRRSAHTAVESGLIKRILRLLGIRPIDQILKLDGEVMHVGPQWRFEKARKERQQP